MTDDLEVNVIQTDLVVVDAAITDLFVVETQPDYDFVVDAATTEPLVVETQPDYDFVVSTGIEAVGIQGIPGPPGSGVFEDIVLAYTDGALTTVTSSSGTKTLDYQLGRLVSVSDTALGTVKNLSYNLDGQLVAVSLA